LRAVFLMIGCMWITLAVIILIAAFAQTTTRKPIVLFCGFALLAQIPIWVGLMGWFVGNEMFLAAGALIACGGLLLPPVSPP
jgi:glucose-6-phosphate-specific signal transduction histidine kinase